MDTTDGCVKEIGRNPESGVDGIFWTEKVRSIGVLEYWSVVDVLTHYSITPLLRSIGAAT
jgi:hypothetical protein